MLLGLFLCVFLQEKFVFIVFHIDGLVKRNTL